MTLENQNILYYGLELLVVVMYHDIFVGCGGEWKGTFGSAHKDIGGSLPIYYYTSLSSCKSFCEANALCKSILYYPYLSYSFYNCRLSTNEFTAQTGIVDNGFYGGSYTTYWRDFSSCVTSPSKNSNAYILLEIKLIIMTVYLKKLT